MGGAAFSAAILPRIHACDATAAKTISDNMNMEIAENARMSAGFAAVKEAFEATYTCLGMTCAHVGGLIIDGTEYYEGAGPCTSPASTGDLVAHQRQLRQ